MYDPRFDALANTLTRHSIKVQPREIVLIESIDVPQEMVIALIRAVRTAEAIPIVELKENRIRREIILDSTDVGIKEIADCEAYRMERVDAYIGLQGSHNSYEMADVPAQALQRYAQYWLTPVHFKIRMKKKWVVLQWPHPETAQQAGINTEALEDFCFHVCTLDYAYMERATAPLKAIMEATDEVHIIDDNGTDLRFSIKDIPVIPCTGEMNLPDGECFTAPVRDSVNGTIQFNTRTIYHGAAFDDIRLRFENGKIVDAAANDSYMLNDILDTDEGARYIGEFSIAFNPVIRFPMAGSSFYDEKIAGSFHIGIGQAYEEADNGNRSAIHWDMVMIQTLVYGGGDIYFDGNLIRRDGWFIHPALEALNPENFFRT